MKWLYILCIGIIVVSGCKKDTGTGPEPEPNSPLSVAVETPGNLEVPADAEISFSMGDSDGLISAELSGSFPDGDGDFDITKNFTGQTSWDTTIVRPVEKAGAGRFDAVATSNTPTGEESEAASADATYTLRETSDTQFSSLFSNTRVGEQTEYLLRGSDADGITRILHKEVLPQTTDTLTTEIDVSGTSFEQTLQKTFEQQGQYVSRLEVTDKLGNTAIDENTIGVYAPLVNRKILVDAGYPGINVNFELDFNGQSMSGETNNQGKASAEFSAPQDSTIDYSIAADALGLLKKQVHGQSSTDETLEMTLQKVPITITKTLPGQYPGEQDVRDITELVTIEDPEQGSVPFEIHFSYQGNNFELSNEGSVYTFTPTKNETGITENFSLSVQAPFDNNKQETITKEIFSPRTITIDDIFPDGKENTNLVLQEFDTNYVQSQATIDSVNVSTNDANISVTRNGESFTITPNQGFFGQANITAYARNIDGAEKNEQRTIFFEGLPRANITAINSVTNQNIESYLLFRDETTAVIDSLVSDNGQFQVAIPENATGLAVAEHQNGIVKSFEHYIPIDPSQTITRTVPVEDFRAYDINRNYTGEMSLFDMKRFKKLMKVVHGQAPVINLDGGSQGDFPGVLHRATESNNGIGYNVLVIPDTTDWVNSGEIGIMETGTPELIENEYITKIAPIMENFATPVERKERISYLVTNESNRNKAHMNPRHINNAFGLVGVKGRLPYINEHTITQILQDGERTVLSETGKKIVALQELTNGMIYFSPLQAAWGGSDGIPAEYRLGPDESIIHDSTTRLDLSVFDRKAGWMIYEPHNVPGEKIDHILSIPNQIKAEYDAL